MKTELTLAVAARLLEYPHARMADQARAAAGWLDGPVPEAAALARRFAEDVEGLSLGTLQEAYTAAFDFVTAGTLYAGEYLLGPTSGRAAFLARLRVLQRDCGVPASAELPDHATELLRLSAAMPSGDERDELLRDGLLPTLRAALEVLDPEHPFANAVAAVIAVVEHVVPAVEAAVQTGRVSTPVRLRLVETRTDDADPLPLFEPSPEVIR